MAGIIFPVPGRFNFVTDLVLADIKSDNVKVDFKPQEGLNSQVASYITYLVKDFSSNHPHRRVIIYACKDSEVGQLTLDIIDSGQEDEVLRFAIVVEEDVLISQHYREWLYKSH
jgi:hypothetical protein